MTETIEPVRSLEDLFRCHHGTLVRYAFVLTGNQALADDLVQEAFARYARGARPEPGRELGYLRRTVANLSSGHFRRLAIVRRTPADPEPPAHHGADVDYERREQYRALAAAVRGLPHRQRDCVVLRYHAGLSEAEIAAELGISTGSVKTHLHRARAALAEHLGSR